MLHMKFGFFDDNNREYVITTPKTPLPWINYLGCNDFFTLYSNTCGGYTFYKDAKHNFLFDYPKRCRFLHLLSLVFLHFVFSTPIHKV